MHNSELLARLAAQGGDAEVTDGSGRSISDVLSRRREDGTAIIAMVSQAPSTELIERAIRSYPAANGKPGWKYGLDDLDFEDFAPDLAAWIAGQSDA